MEYGFLDGRNMWLQYMAFFLFYVFLLPFVHLFILLFLFPHCTICRHVLIFIFALDSTASK
jgi:hypothetical protein